MTDASDGNSRRDFLKQGALLAVAACGAQLLSPAEARAAYPKLTHGKSGAFGSYQWIIAQAVKPNDLLGGVRRFACVPVPRLFAGFHAAGEAGIRGDDRGLRRSAGG